MDALPSQAQVVVVAREHPPLGATTNLASTGEPALRVHTPTPVAVSQVSQVSMIMHHVEQELYR